MRVYKSNEITVSVQEYKELISNEVKLQMLENFVRNNSYVNREDISKLLNIPISEER